MFNNDIVKKVLLFYLDFIEDKRPIILYYKTRSPYDFACDILVNNPTIKKKRVFKIVGFKLISGTVPLRELRNMFFKQNYRSWNKMLKDLALVKLPKQDSPFKPIRDAIEKFQPLKLVDFKHKMLNNDKYN